MYCTSLSVKKQILVLGKWLLRMFLLDIIITYVPAYQQCCQLELCKLFTSESNESHDFYYVSQVCNSSVIILSHTFIKIMESNLQSNFFSPFLIKILSTKYKLIKVPQSVLRVKSTHFGSPSDPLSPWGKAKPSYVHSLLGKVKAS